MSDVRVPDINRVIVAGRLTRDVELKQTSGGKPFAKLAIVNSRRYKPQNSSEWQEIATFIDVTLWGPGAESIAKLGKGRPVLVEGALSMSEWEDKATGQKRSRIEVNADRVSPLDWGQGPTAENREPKPEPPRMTQDAQASYQARPLAEDDIPF